MHRTRQTALFAAFLVGLLCASAFAGRSEKLHTHDDERPAANAPAAAGPDKQDEPERRFDPIERYADREILGWPLKVHEDLLAQEELAEQVFAEMHHQLYRLTRVMPEDKLEHLREVVLWVELRNPEGGSACYHPSRGWLENNNHLPAKARGIEIGNAESFLRYTKRDQPFVLLHELAHAYHHRVLGFEHPPIIAAYERAAEAGIYEEVLFISGRRTVRHYALTDHKEFFAESTEAFFGQNDFYPFVQGELLEHDPETYALMIEVWGIEPGR